MSSNLDNALTAVPATAPVKKHVNFSSSTLERASHEELGKSPSPMKFGAGSEVPTGAVIYPNLSSVVNNLELSQEAETLKGSPSRRLVFGGEAPNHPRSFSFESGKAVNFGTYDWSELIGSLLLIFFQALHQPARSAWSATVTLRRVPKAASAS